MKIHGTILCAGMLIVGGMLLGGCPWRHREECGSLTGEYCSMIYRLDPWTQPGGSAVLRAIDIFNGDGTGLRNVIRPDGTVVEDVPFTYEIVDCGEYSSVKNVAEGNTVETTGFYNSATDCLTRVDHSVSGENNEISLGFGFKLPQNRPSLLGDYVAMDIMSDPQGMAIETHQREMVFNGDGTGTLFGATEEEDVDFVYTVQEDGALDIAQNDWDLGLMDGIVSEGGKAFLGLDREGGDDSRIGIQIAFRRSADMAPAAAAGVYNLVALHDTGDSVPWALRGTLTLDADGTGTLVEMATSGLGMPAPRAVAYTFAGTGEIVLTYTEDGEVAEGILSEDANVMVLADFEQEQDTDAIGLLFCVRKP